MPCRGRARIPKTALNTKFLTLPDIRDIKAGKAAGMRTLAAAYGYLGSNEPIEAWSADAIIEHPLEILSFIKKTDRVL